MLPLPTGILWYGKGSSCVERDIGYAYKQRSRQ